MLSPGSSRKQTGLTRRAAPNTIRYKADPQPLARHGNRRTGGASLKDLQQGNLVLGLAKTKSLSKDVLKGL